MVEDNRETSDEKRVTSQRSLLVSHFSNFSREGSGTPIAQVKEVVPDRSAGQFGDGRQHTLELVLANPLGHLVNEGLGEAGLHALLGAVTPVDQQVEQPVHVLVGEAQLSLVRLRQAERRPRNRDSSCTEGTFLVTDLDCSLYGIYTWSVTGYSPGDSG